MVILMNKNIKVSFVLFTYILSGCGLDENRILSTAQNEKSLSTELTSNLAATKSQCFWMNQNTKDSTWVPVTEMGLLNTSKAECFALDSCDGGLGQSGGGCYKWAEGAHEPKDSWDHFVVGTTENCPQGYQHMTFDEAQSNAQQVCETLGTWDIARLADGGSMDGPGYDCKIRESDDRELGHSICILNQTSEEEIFGCYWMENYSGNYNWVPVTEISLFNISKAECFALDSCDGGLGLSGGGCYKWAEGANEPRESWDQPSSNGYPSDSVVETTSSPSATAFFVSESAGYKNTLYTYDIDDQGQITNVRQLIGDSHQVSPGASLGEISISDGKPNLLLLPNGSNLVDEGSKLTVIGGALYINWGQYTGDAYFSHSAEMSTDGKDHFLFSVDEDGNTLVKIEDLRNLGDKDFNDLEIKVTETCTE